MNKQIFEEYLFSLETIASEMNHEELNYIIKTIDSLPDEYKEKVMECVSIAIEAGKESSYS